MVVVKAVGRGEERRKDAVGTVAARMVMHGEAEKRDGRAKLA